MARRRGRDHRARAPGREARRSPPWPTTTGARRSTSSKNSPGAFSTTETEPGTEPRKVRRVPSRRSRTRSRRRRRSWRLSAEVSSVGTRPTPRTRRSRRRFTGRGARWSRVSRRTRARRVRSRRRRALHRVLPRSMARASLVGGVLRHDVRGERGGGSRRRGRVRFVGGGSIRRGATREEFGRCAPPRREMGRSHIFVRGVRRLGTVRGGTERSSSPWVPSGRRALRSRVSGRGRRHRRRRARRVRIVPYCTYCVRLCRRPRRRGYLRAGDDRSQLQAELVPRRIPPFITPAMQGSPGGNPRDPNEWVGDSRALLVAAAEQEAKAANSSINRPSSPSIKRKSWGDAWAALVGGRADRFLAIRRRGFRAECLGGAASTQKPPTRCPRTIVARRSFVWERRRRRRSKRRFAARVVRSSRATRPAPRTARWRRLSGWRTISSSGTAPVTQRRTPAGPRRVRSRRSEDRPWNVTRSLGASAVVARGAAHRRRSIARRRFDHRRQPRRRRGGRVLGGDDVGVYDARQSRGRLLQRRRTSRTTQRTRGASAGTSSASRPSRRRRAGTHPVRAPRPEVREVPEPRRESVEPKREVPAPPVDVSPPPIDVPAPAPAVEGSASARRSRGWGFAETREKVEIAEESHKRHHLHLTTSDRARHRRGRCVECVKVYNHVMSDEEGKRVFKRVHPNRTPNHPSVCSANHTLASSSKD